MPESLDIPNAPISGLNLPTSRSGGDLPDGGTSSDPLAASPLAREDLAGVPRTRHPDDWAPLLPFTIETRVGLRIEAIGFGVNVGTLAKSVAASITATAMGVNLGVMDVLKTGVSQYATAIDSAQDRQLGDQTITTAAKIFPLTIAIGVGTIALPVAAKVEPTLVGVGLGNRDLGVAAKIAPVANPNVDIGNRSLSLAAKIEGISFIANLGTRDALAAAAKIAPVANPVGKRSYIDTLNRSNAANLGSNWASAYNGSTQIISNAAQAKTASSNTGRQGAWNMYQGAEFGDSGRLYTDSYRIKAQLKAPSTSLASDNMTVIGFSHDTFTQTGINKCYLVVTTANGCAIYTQSGTMVASGISTGQTGQTQRAVTSTSIAVTDFVELERVGNLWTAYRNGSTFGLSWNDSGGLVPTGASFRRPVLAIECNYPIFQQQFSSPGIDQVEFWDL